MGLNWKEKFQNINKKNVAIGVAILFVIALVSVLGVEYYNMKNFEATTLNPENMVVQDSELSAEDEAILAQTTQQKKVEEPTKKPSEYKIGVPFEKAMAGNKPVLVLFYADWCHYCIRFMPTYQKLSEDYKNTLAFSKVNVEDEKYQNIVKNYSITGFPTVYLVDPKYDNRVLLSNALFGDMTQLKGELDRFVRIRSLLDSKK